MENTSVHTGTALGGVVCFAGSRHGSVPRAQAVVSALASHGVSFLVGCAPGVDRSFRQALVPFASRTTVHCAFRSRARQVAQSGLIAICTVGTVPSAAAALHWRTVGMVSDGTFLVLFPDVIPKPPPGAGAPLWHAAPQCSSISRCSSSPLLRPSVHGTIASRRCRSAAWSQAIWWYRQKRRLLMRRNNVPRIRIAPVDGSSDRYIAAFTSDALNATFSVVFQENVSGAVALHSFAEMIRSGYDAAPELTVVDSLPTDMAVSDALQSLERPLVEGPRSCRSGRGNAVPIQLTSTHTRSGSQAVATMHVYCPPASTCSAVPAITPSSLPITSAGTA